MTFNTTILCVEQLKLAGFVERDFMRPRAGFERNRIMMVTQAIDALLNAPAPPFPRFPAGVSMDGYRAGHLVTVSRDAGKQSNFKLLENVDELWAFSIRTPKDFQARLFGRFVQRDIFVATEAHLRVTLGGSVQYHAMATRASSEWDNLAGGVKPLRSNSIADYLGHTVRDLDEND